MSEFIKVNDLIKRDLSNDEEEPETRYQIQCVRNSNIVKLAFVKETTDMCLQKIQIKDIICSLIMYTLSNDDLNNNRYYMIGYIIKNKDNHPIYTLNVIFCPIEYVAHNQMKGKFQIILSDKNGKNNIMHEYNTFLGQEETVYTLTEILRSIILEQRKGK